jgi:hypothetical protein
MFIFSTKNTMRFSSAAKFVLGFFFLMYLLGRMSQCAQKKTPDTSIKHPEPVEYYDWVNNRYIYQSEAHKYYYDYETKSYKLKSAYASKQVVKD